MEEDDQITHGVTLDTKCDAQTLLDVFKADDAFEEHEGQWRRIQGEMLGGGEGEVRGVEWGMVRGRWVVVGEVRRGGFASGGCGLMG